MQWDKMIGFLDRAVLMSASEAAPVADARQDASLRAHASMPLFSTRKEHRAIESSCIQGLWDAPEVQLVYDPSVADHTVSLAVVCRLPELFASSARRIAQLLQLPARQICALL